jgi:glycosyltransferase involved in cell wall biosynthesis
MGVNPDESRFSTAECHDSDSMLAVGPLVESSGFMDLIQAVCILRDRGRFARLTIIGEGPFEGTLRAQINGHGLADRIKLIGGVSRTDLAMLMRVHTVMVLPWVSEDRDRDVLTNTVLEAMSAGLLVLSTDLPGIRELIDDGLSGRVISPNDPLWLAGALETLFDSPTLREQMVRRARTKVERRFAAAHNVSHLAQLFFEAVSRKRLAT